MRRKPRKVKSANSFEFSGRTGHIIYSMTINAT
jgi:hypothetical protein